MVSIVWFRTPKSHDGGRVKHTPLFTFFAGTMGASLLLSGCSQASHETPEPSSLLGQTVSEVTEDQDLGLSLGIQDILKDIDSEAVISASSEQMIVAACKSKFEHDHVNVGVIPAESANPQILQQAKNGKFTHLLKGCA